MRLAQDEQGSKTLQGLDPREKVAEAGGGEEGWWGACLSPCHADVVALLSVMPTPLSNYVSEAGTGIPSPSTEEGFSNLCCAFEGEEASHLRDALEQQGRGEGLAVLVRVHSRVFYSAT